MGVSDGTVPGAGAFTPIMVGGGVTGFGGASMRESIREFKELASFAPTGVGGTVGGGGTGAGGISPGDEGIDDGTDEFTSDIQLHTGEIHLYIKGKGKKHWSQ